MRARVNGAFLCFAVAAFATPVLAQQTTGAIVGTVKDATGASLPGVTASLKGPGIVGTQTAVTNETGFYRFPALPPGAYSLSFALSGFSTLTREGVRVSLGSTSEENAALKLSQLAEEITVSGEAAVINTQGNEVSTNYDKDWVRNAPVPRFSFFDLINAAPGVSAATSEAGGSITSTRSSSLGGSSSDNNYQIDGTDLTSPSDGNAWPYPNTDAIEEIQVLSLGAPAEYGNVQGAVFNVVTRQGSNAFHGDANFYYQSNGLTGNNTDKTLADGSFADACPTDADPNARCPFHRNAFQDMTLQLSGPVVQDKLWFFVSYQHQKDAKAVAGTPAEFPTTAKADRVFGKINWQISAKHKLQFAYHNDYYHLPFQTSSVEDPKSVAEEHGNNPTPNVTYTWVKSDKTYLEARFSGFYGSDHGDPTQSGVARIQPRYLDVDTGLITGGVYSWYDGSINRTGASVKISHFADKFLGGSHDFKFGVQYNQGGRDYIIGTNDYIYTYSLSGYPSFGYTQLPWHNGGKERSTGIFVDDTYRIGSRLSLNIGVRFDHARASFDSFPALDREGNPTGAVSQGIDNVFTWDSPAPRLGFNYKLTSDGKTVLRGHYGRYYRGIITGEFEPASPAYPPRYLFSGTYDAQGNPQDLTLVSDNSQLKVDSHFKNPYTDQFIVGFERELTKDVGLSMNYVYKRGEQYGGWRDTNGQYSLVPYSDTAGADASGRDIPVYRLDSEPSASQFLLTNPGEMFTRFSGLTVQLTKRMSHNWQATASLVLSKSTGRIASSLTGPASSAGAAAGNLFGQNPNDYINTDERLPSDRPVIGKLQFVYMLPKGFLLGANYTYQSGRPWARQVKLSQDLAGLPTNILAEKLTGDRRVSSQNVLDVRVQKEFSITKTVGLAVFTDMLNLLNNDAYENIGSRLGTSASYGLPTQFILPRRFLLGAKLKF